MHIVFSRIAFKKTRQKYTTNVLKREWWIMNPSTSCTRAAINICDWLYFAWPGRRLFTYLVPWFRFSPSVRTNSSFLRSMEHLHNLHLSYKQYKYTVVMLLKNLKFVKSRKIFIRDFLAHQFLKRLSSLTELQIIIPNFCQLLTFS